MVWYRIDLLWISFPAHTDMAMKDMAHVTRPHFRLIRFEELGSPSAKFRLSSETSIMSYSTISDNKRQHQKTWTITHKIHVWYICHYLPTFGWFCMVHVGKYTSPMDAMGKVLNTFTLLHPLDSKYRPRKVKLSFRTSAKGSPFVAHILLQSCWPVQPLQHTHTQAFKWCMANMRPLCVDDI